MLFYEPTQYKQLTAEIYFSGSVLAFLLAGKVWQKVHQRLDNTQHTIINKILYSDRFYHYF